MPMPAFIGVDVGGTSIRAARFLGHSHKPDAKVKHPTLAARGFEAVMDRLEQAIREVLPSNGGEIAGIGIAAPGPSDPKQGMVISAPNLPGWQRLPLKRIMEDRLGWPVHIGNDANLAALGEWKFGAGRGHDDVLYLTISTGIGGGVISGGRLLVGATGLAAEVGHILAVPDGPVCGCGQRGHLEAVASGTAIGTAAVRRLKAGHGADSKIWELAGGEAEAVTAAIVGRAALAGDSFARSLLAEAGTFIGRSLASLLHIFNPSIVILGGGVALDGDVLLEPVRAAMKSHAMTDFYWRQCEVVKAALADDAGLVGAGVLAMEESMIKEPASLGNR